jgi:hypothetical protein
MDCQISTNPSFIYQPRFATLSLLSELVLNISVSSMSGNTLVGIFLSFKAYFMEHFPENAYTS